MNKRTYVTIPQTLLDVLDASPLSNSEIVTSALVEYLRLHPITLQPLAVQPVTDTLDLFDPDEIDPIDD
jgi:hypothetical protein